MIHFLDFSNEKMAAKAPDLAKQSDILLGNLEDAIPVDKKEAAREGLIKAAKENDFGETAPSGRASTRSRAPGFSTTSPRSSPRSATSSR